MITKKIQFFKGIAPYVFTLIFIGLILVFSRSQWKEYANISQVSVSTVFWLSALFILMQITVGYMLKIFVEVFNIRLGIVEWFGLVSVQSFANYLPFSAGVAHNAAYLKLKNDLPLTKYASLFSASTILMFLTFGIWGMLLLLVRQLIWGNSNITLLCFSLFFTFIGVGFLLLPMPRITRKNRVCNWIESIRDGWELIKKSNLLLIKVVLLQTLVLIILSVRFFIIFRDLGYDFGIIGIVILTIMTTLIRFTSLFPGNLGLRESIAGGVTKSFGLSFNSGFLAGIIDRVVVMFWIFLLGMIFSFVLIRKKTTKTKICNEEMQKI
jgi:uncharacterized membrane protein YbhN (UPF0104 family)